MQRKTKTLVRLTSVLGLTLALAIAGGIMISAKAADKKGKKTAIQVKGSDTMVNLAQAWAEAYHKVNPNVEIEVSGGGSGVGIAALMKGTIDIADASRNMKPAEIEQTKKSTGQTPKEIIVAYDGLAVYINKNNPLNEITLDQLLDIYSEGGKITKWSQLGVKIPDCDSDEIIRVSRQSNSGTYEFFREHVLKNKDFKNGSRDMNGSKEVVDLVTSTACAIGYSGLGYATPKVKIAKVAFKGGQPAVAPSIPTVLDKSYPIARSLQVYTLGEPKGEIKKYIDWTLSDPGQKIVEESGYVPLPQNARVASK